MAIRKVPVEVAGFLNRHVLDVDDCTDEYRYKWRSFVNDNFEDDDILPWSGNSEVDDCPF